MRCGTLICFRSSCLVLLFWFPVFRGMVILSLKSHSPLPPPTPLTPLPPPPPNLHCCCCCWKWDSICSSLVGSARRKYLCCFFFCSVLYFSLLFTLHSFFLSSFYPPFFVSLILASSFYSFIYTKRLHE